MDVQIGKMLKRYSESDRISDFDMQEEAQAHMDDLRNVFARVSFEYTEMPKKLQKSEGPLFDFLAANGVIADWREPNVIRFAPVPLYNSFEDVWQMGQLITKFKA
jgi:kynureninase